MHTPTLYLLLGLPGAGKTTTAKEISKLTGAVHLSSDNIRLELFTKPCFSQAEHDALYESLDKTCEQLLRGGKNVIYDANLNRYIHRQEKYELAKRVGAATRLLWIDVSRSTAKQRRLDEKRHHSLVPTNETPQAMFERIADIFEPPKRGEAYTLLDGTRITTDYIKSILL